MPIGGMPRERVQEIWGVTAAMASLLVAVSLLSHTSADPSFFSSSRGPVHNLAGRVGANLSEALFQLIGAGAYLLPVLGGIVAWNGLTKHPLCTWSGAGGAALLGFSLSTLAALYLPHGDIYGGGLLGDAVAGVLLAAFAWVGTLIVVVALTILAVLIITPFSLRRLGRRLGDVGWQLRERVSGLFVVRRERARRKHAPPSPRRTDTPAPPPRIADLPDPPMVTARQETLAFMRGGGSYQLPPLTLLADPVAPARRVGKDELVMNSRLLEKKLADFDVDGTVKEVHPGPVITMFEVELVPGLKVSKVFNLADDLALAMKAPSVRIVSPLPGKSTIGIEIPNQNRDAVALKEILSAPEFLDAPFALPLALGKDIFGQPVVADLAAMPHLLVAGATGSGKSVALNTMILSLLCAASPHDVRLLMIDPKMLELSAYDAIPHLLAPVVTQPKDAAVGLVKIVAEMQRRYRLLAEAGVRNIEGYNKQVAGSAAPPVSRSEAESAESGEAAGATTPRVPLPYIVVVIDELADLMLVAAREVEDSIMRLAQMARAAGIHLIVATQRPSVDVLTGVIKANFPARISFQVSSKTDSRTILDANGAEQLLGRGDMLYLVPGTGRISRIHGAYVSEEEIAAVVTFIKGQAAPSYELSLTPDAPGAPGGGDTERDDLYEKAIQLVAETRQASASFIQRRLRVGYPRAARMIEMMEEDQIVGPAAGGKREVLIRRTVPGEEEV